MDSKTIRLINLETLVAREDKASTFAEKIGMSASQLSQIRNPKYKRTVGDAAARSIESALGLPHGWMDVLHDNEAMRVINEQDETMLKLAKMMLPVATPHSNAHLQRIIEGLEQNQVSDTEKKELEVILKVIAERFFPKGAL